jgi:hypothetical protein
VGLQEAVVEKLQRMWKRQEESVLGKKLRNFWTKKSKLTEKSLSEKKKQETTMKLKAEKNDRLV